MGTMMDTSPAIRAVKVVRIYCPVDHGTMELISAGRFAEIEQQSAFSRIMAIIRDDNALGDFGMYKAVVELSCGWELFTPDSTANPAMGEAGSPTASPTAILTVYIPADASVTRVSDAVSAILAVHPWEIPVIEMGDTSLLVRA